jgi:hypothetical protein
VQFPHKPIEVIGVFAGRLSSLSGACTGNGRAEDFDEVHMGLPDEVIKEFERKLAHGVLHASHLLGVRKRISRLR